MTTAAGQQWPPVVLGFGGAGKPRLLSKTTVAAFSGGRHAGAAVLGPVAVLKALLRVGHGVWVGTCMRVAVTLAMGLLVLQLVLVGGVVAAVPSA